MHYKHEARVHAYYHEIADRYEAGASKHRAGFFPHNAERPLATSELNEKILKFHAMRLEEEAHNFRAAAVSLERRAALYAQLRAKYVRAMRRPWRAVSPDPPPPAE